MTNWYRVEVFVSGQLVAEHLAAGSDALAAINVVEAHYGTSPKIEETTIQLESGKKEHILVVLDWHGYSFVARKLTSSPT